MDLFSPLSCSGAQLLRDFHGEMQNQQGAPELPRASTDSAPAGQLPNCGSSFLHSFYLTTLAAIDRIRFPGVFPDLTQLAREQKPPEPPLEKSHDSDDMEKSFQELYRRDQEEFKRKIATPGEQPELARDDNDQPHQARYRRIRNATPFVQGTSDTGAIAPDDVKQGKLGDCWLLASLAALASARPDIVEKAIIDHGDGSYTVSLPGLEHDMGKGLEVKVDSLFPGGEGPEGRPLYAGAGDSEGGKNEIWPMLIEKAFAKAKIMNYQYIDGDNPAIALTSLTGKETRTIKVNDEGVDAFEEMKRGIENRSPMVLGTRRSTGEPEDGRLFLNAGLNDCHAHAVIGTSMEDGKKMVHLYDPHGREIKVEWDSVKNLFQSLVILSE
ncbi:MAG: C2 family cysteine protease [Candidatus Eremiobacteraeota bacterium]|nr:C2 family cysteine protease [Candidatus Eremiobacteraeota bacterium]